MLTSIPQMFENSVEKYSNNPLLWEKKYDKYESITYKDTKREVLNLSAALLLKNINPADRVAIISEGRNYWVIAELAIFYTGGVSVPISVKIEELTELKFRLAHSGTKLVFVSKQHLNKLRKIKHDLPDLEKIIVLDKINDIGHDEIFIEDFINEGKVNYSKLSIEIDKRVKNIRPNDPATISYTSGTTADPKGVVLTHLNYVTNVDQATDLLPIPEWYISLLILPWDHCFAHVAGIYTLLKNGASMASIQLGNTPLETLRNIPTNIKEIKPTFLLSVPALAKNFKKNIEKGILEKGKMVQKLFDHALKIAYEYNKEGINKGKGVPFYYKGLLKTYDAILFKKIREGFGGRLEFFVGGGALLDIELQRFFYAIGIPMFQGYGLSEATPVISANVMQKHKLGSSGYPVKELEIKILDSDGNQMRQGESGEIVVRGNNVMLGYWKNEKATSETVIDNWLFTGDLGYLDEDGFLYVLGRFKSLLIGNDGEKYSPEGIEESLVEDSKYIDQIMLYNNQSLYTTALIVPNKEKLKLYTSQNNINLETETGADAIIKLIEADINAFKEGGEFEGKFPSRWLPSSFAILGEGFTEQNKLMNSTMKIVRNKIIDFYQNRLDYMYTSEGKNNYNHQNRIIVNRF
ncbi:MAG: AMP-binding protein [Melioribacteraceae bacterium]|nr:AMP-binding protein [Melioribacteraceae bacterium]